MYVYFFLFFCFLKTFSIHSNSFLFFLLFPSGSGICFFLELLHRWSFINKQKILASSYWCPYKYKKNILIKNLNQPCSN
jgi:hypothetical protein